MKALLLPALSLAVVQAAILARVTRSAVLEVMREDYVRTARAKGLSRRAVLWRHVLRNAMIPVLTIMGLQFANLITGTIVVENVFVLPGIGRLVFQAINNRDLVVVRDVVMLLAAVVVAVNFVVDVLYALIDPRLQGGRQMSDRATHRALRHPSFVVGALLSRLLLLAAALSLVWPPYPPAEIDIPNKLASPVVGALARHRQPGPRHRLATAGRRQNSIVVGVVAVGIGLLARRRARLPGRGAARLGRRSGDAPVATSPSPSRRCCRPSC